MDILVNRMKTSFICIFDLGQICIFDSPRSLVDHLIWIGCELVNEDWWDLLRVGRLFVFPFLCFPSGPLLYIFRILGVSF